MLEHMFEIWVIVGAILALVTLPGTLETLLLIVGLFLPVRRAGRGKGQATGEPPKRIAVVVPAHNEESGIGRCVQSLLSCEWSGGEFQIVVVADNCSDATAQRAEEAGARALVRNNLEERGKGYALDFAFTTLCREGFDAFIVVDADSTVSTSLISAFAEAYASGAPAAQCRYLLADAERGGRAQLNAVAVNTFNNRVRSRSGWGFSVGILGNGFGLTAETVSLVPYHARSVVEDLEYHLRLIRAGKKVFFIPDASVTAEMPPATGAEETQRARWEGGRYRMIMEFAPGLVGDILKGKGRLLEAFLDLTLLPLSHQILLLLAVLTAPNWPLRIYALCGIGLLGMQVLVSVLLTENRWKNLRVLASAPIYILWKISFMVAQFASARKGADWVRTERKK